MLHQAEFIARLLRRRLSRDLRHCGAYRHTLQYWLQTTGMAWFSKQPEECSFMAVLPLYKFGWGIVWYISCDVEKIVTGYGRFSDALRRCGGPYRLETIGRGKYFRRNLAAFLAGSVSVVFSGHLRKNDRLSHEIAYFILIFIVRGYSLYHNYGNVLDHIQIRANAVI
ncbi:hypothetical protein BGW36DRAFT_407879 [Talaromyces proteolyticus]|uniref:Uncharacterized protein n=1 Tax=Talaromyces proteolyticus TaxID=1131652 RepID=A0AAD4KS40_9EURO|nr:uncharacterized protein BGW36DRAFT_407879 [Talaromyces proteolyticus]KAH8697984.1 hypothetical protein BGW36DRAFT_407879 [Talaromyces proteolyticus]